MNRCCKHDTRTIICIFHRLKTTLNSISVSERKKSSFFQWIFWPFPASKVESSLKELHRDHKPQAQGNVSADQWHKQVASGWVLAGIEGKCSLFSSVPPSHHPSLASFHIFQRVWFWLYLYICKLLYENILVPVVSGLEDEHKTIAVMRLLTLEDFPSGYRRSPLRCSTPGPSMGACFRGPGDRVRSNNWRQTFCYGCTNKSSYFLGENGLF